MISVHMLAFSLEYLRISNDDEHIQEKQITTSTLQHLPQSPFLNLKKLLQLPVGHNWRSVGELALE